jgi:hypothetical protein
MEPLNFSITDIGRLRPEDATRYGSKIVEK